jgi:hypothetical protein
MGLAIATAIIIFVVGCLGLSVHDDLEDIKRALHISNDIDDYEDIEPDDYSEYDYDDDDTEIYGEDC